jgi:hypothetical protein
MNEQVRYSQSRDMQRVPKTALCRLCGRGVFDVENYFSPRFVNDEEDFIAYLGFRRLSVVPAYLHTNIPTLFVSSLYVYYESFISIPIGGDSEIP